MTKEEILKAAEHCTIECSGNCSGCPLSGKGCISIFTQYIINKENEPAPAGTDTSSKNNNLQLNDTANLRICQEQLERLKIELKCITYSSDIECMKERILQVSGALEMISNIIAGDGE